MNLSSPTLDNTATFSSCIKCTDLLFKVIEKKNYAFVFLSTTKNGFRPTCTTIHAMQPFVRLFHQGAGIKFNHSGSNLRFKSCVAASLEVSKFCKFRKYV